MAYQLNVAFDEDVKSHLYSDGECVKSHIDQMLHKILGEIFRECCSNISSEIKEFLRVHMHTFDSNRQILKQIITRIRQSFSESHLHSLDRNPVNWLPAETILDLSRHSSNKDMDSLQNPILDLILEQEPGLGRQFPKEILTELSLLWIAVLGSYHKSAELLVRSGADVNEPFGSHYPWMMDRRWTVLYKLIEMDPSSENERLIRLIMDHGADLQAKVSFSQTVLHCAVAKGRVQLTEMFLKKGTVNVNASDGYDGTPLLVAACKRKADELLPLLIKHGADIFALNHIGENVLHRLSYGPTEHIELARALIDKGVSIDHRDSCERQYRPIHMAIEAGHNELVKLYLDHGAKLNWLVYEGRSPLHLAARYGKPEVLKTLLERGVDIHHRETSKGHTALHAACKYFRSIRDENIIKILLSAGADMLIEDCDSKTPLDLIMEPQNIDNPSINLMISKLLALMKGRLQPSIDLKDERIIERYPKLWDYYRDCMEQVERAKSTRFIETCTFFDLLAKCHCQIAALMRNPELERKFKLYDLSGFSMYAEDIKRTFERAQKHYHFMLEQEDLINEALNDILPYIIVRRVVHYIVDCCKNVK